MVIVEGSIQTNKWTDNATGEERESYYINALNIRFAGSKKDADIEIRLVTQQGKEREGHETVALKHI